MAEIWTMGELLVEIMRPRPGMALSRPGEFLGPFPSGAPAIFIDTVARLGHSGGIIGGVGKDEFGFCLMERLRGHGVDVRYVREVPDRSTAVAFVAYSPEGSRNFIFHIDGTPAVTAGFPPGAREEKPEFFHVMGCSLMASDGMRASIFEAMRSYHAGGARISFDPNIRPELLAGRDAREITEPVLDLCSVLLPGVAELQMLSGHGGIEESVRALFDESPLQFIVLKRGRRGATVYTRSGSVEVPAYSVREVDPTGAGDSFDAGFLCGMLEERPVEECARLAAAAGALNAASFGPMEGDISPRSLRNIMAGV
jgi:sugar/nucleoside kinase (ribokinase family)